MIVIGLTGSIGMGKSTVAAQMRDLGVRITSADSIVHKLLEKGGAAVKQVNDAFPTVSEKGSINRKALGNIVFQDKAKLHILENILHPIVAKAEIDFVARQQRLGAPLVVLEIPLLFETRADERCDYTVVTSAPFIIQRQRVLKRPDMTEDKFRSILHLQMPDVEKCRRADCIIPTGLGKAHSHRAIVRMLHELQQGIYT